MDATKILNGSCDFDTTGFAKSVVTNQLGFTLNRAVWQATSKAETPVFDARLAKAMGDNGLPERTVYDADDLCRGYAAAFIVLTRHIKTPNPENGRKPEHLVRYVKTPDSLIMDGVQFRINNQTDQIKADAVAFGSDPGPRLAAMKAEQMAQAKALGAPVMDSFLAAVEALGNEDTCDLIDIAMESAANAKINVAGELKDAARRYIDAQKKRFDAGKYAHVSSGVFALAGAAATQAPVLTSTPAEPVKPVRPLSKKELKLGRKTGPRGDNSL
jgi:hypothetical protein